MPAARLQRACSVGRPGSLLGDSTKACSCLLPSLLCDYTAPVLFRVFTGCGADGQNHGAVIVETHRLTSSAIYARIDPTLRARAHSLAACVHWEKYHSALESKDQLADIIQDEWREAERLGIAATYKLETDPIPILFTAARHANESVKLGLVSRATLFVGKDIRQRAAEKGWQDTELAVRMPMFADLWDALLKHLRDAEEKQKAQERKVEKRPNEYICAGPGCGIGAKQRTTLKMCSGGCPKELKPSYCSKECQKKVYALS